MRNVTSNLGLNPVRPLCGLAAPGLHTLPTVLHVEDDPNDALLLNICFRRAHLPVSLQHVPDGQQALHYLIGSAQFADRLAFPLPRLLILDLKLPFLDGFGVLAWARSQPGLAGLPIIVLSSSDQPEDISRARRLGADLYLVKSSSYADVITAVQNCLGTARSEPRRMNPLA